MTQTQTGPTYVAESFDAKISELRWQTLGLSYTASGYGKKIPSRYVVRIHGEKTWRRVYVTQYSNSGTHWITRNGEPFHVIRSTDLEEALGR